MDIMRLSAKEIMLISEFAKLAEEAFRAEQLIKETFTQSFGLDKKEIHVFHTETGGEYYGDGYLSIDGVFRYHDNWWGGREYAFTCDAERIYHLLRSCYLRKNDLGGMDPDIFDCDIEYIDSYFREFIENISKGELPND